MQTDWLTYAKNLLARVRTACRELLAALLTTPLKIAVAVGILLLTFLSGAWLVYNWLRPSEKVVTEDAKVLLEKVQRVCKLVTVEGTFSDIYSYKDYAYYDISPFQKKALMTVNAKVQVGIDLTKSKFKSNSLTKTLIISDIPPPEILSIETDLKYYDITEGTFNSFSEAELTKLNQNAKEQIRQKAQNSSLIHIADEQGNAIFDIITLFCNDAGWQVVFDPPRVLKN